MKKVIFVFAALLISLNSFAQFGVMAGITSSSANVGNFSTEIDGSATICLHGGVTYKIALGKGDEVFVIQPSLIYNVKGAGMSDSNENAISFALQALGNLTTNRKGVFISMAYLF